MYWHFKQSVVKTTDATSHGADVVVITYKTQDWKRRTGLTGSSCCYKTQDWRRRLV